MYQAIVGKISVSPHPNADRLQLGYVCGHRVVVGLETVDGEVGVFFPPDGQLSEAYAKAHDLVARKDALGNKINNGYFDQNRRVRAQAFRQIKSEGFYMPLQSLQFTGYDLTKLKIGDSFDELNKVPICNKYFTKATRQAMQSGKRTSLKWLIDMPEHYETAQFRFVDVPMNSLVHISEKEHGTSFRYGNVLVKRRRNWFARLFKSEYEDTRQYVLGTRRAILPKIERSEYEFGGGYYGNGDPYTIVPAKLYGKLKDNEVVYGEVVGYLQTGAALFSQNTSKLPDIKKQYGENMIFSYGCIQHESKFKVYRITQDGRDLSWFELKRRCNDLDVDTVTTITSLVFKGDRDSLNSTVEELLEGPSILDNRHIREGVCLRIESEHGIRIVKSKSWTFGVLEGYLKDNENYVDMEEVA
jgi:hypothetical protein